MPITWSQKTLLTIYAKLYSQLSRRDQIAIDEILNAKLQTDIEPDQSSDIDLPTRRHGRRDGDQSRD